MDIPVSIKIEPEDPDEILNDPAESTSLTKIVGPSSINQEGFQYTEMSRRAQADVDSNAKPGSMRFNSKGKKQYIPRPLSKQPGFVAPKTSRAFMKKDYLKTSQLIASGKSALTYSRSIKRIAPTSSISPETSAATRRRPMSKSNQLPPIIVEVKEPEDDTPETIIKYKCTSCSSSFFTNAQLAVHYTDIHKNKQECEFCGMEFANSQAVSDHQSNLHISYGKAWHAIDPCDMQSYKLIAFFKCIYCQYVSRARCSLESHYGKNHKKYVAFKKTHCDVCKSNFPSFKEKLGHPCSEPVAKKPKLATCLCTAYNKHSKAQTCKMCESKLPCAGMLIKHTLEGKFSCRKCSEKFCLAADAQKHMLSKHKVICKSEQITRSQRATLPEKKSKLSKIGKNEHYCVYCTNFYTCRSYRATKKVCNDLDDMSYSCEECFNLFDTRFQVWKHFLSTKHKSAPKCSKFSQAEQDELKATAEKLTDEDFKCFDCGAEMKKICYDFHMQVDHGKIAYLCKMDRFCGKMFYSRSDMEDHEQDHRRFIQAGRKNKIPTGGIPPQQLPSFGNKNFAVEKTGDLRKPMPQFVNESDEDYGHKLFCALQFKNDPLECLEEA